MLEVLDPASLIDGLQGGLQGKLPVDEQYPESPYAEDFTSSFGTRFIMLGGHGVLGASSSSLSKTVGSGS